jgi:CheY-like chemotaxis protein
MNATDAADGILVIDDTTEIHEDFRKILAPTLRPDAETDDMARALFGEPARSEARWNFAVDSAMQGETGLARVVQALSVNRPYSLAFVDMRMPPGWDGVETIRQLWAVDPLLQIVICTAYSDFSWTSVIDQLGGGNNLIVLKKPFDNIEVLQLARTLTEKWRLARSAGKTREQVEAEVADRMAELLQAKEAAEQTAGYRDVVIAHLDQDFRPPLNGVVALCSVLRKTALNPAQHECTEAIAASGASMLGRLDALRAGAKPGR